QIQVPETNGLCIATEEFITCGHSNLGRSSALLSFSRLRTPTFRAKRTERRNSITNFSLTTFPNLPPQFRAKRTERRNSITNFSITTFPILPPPFPATHTQPPNNITNLSPP